MFIGLEMYKGHLIKYDNYSGKYKVDIGCQTYFFALRKDARQLIDNKAKGEQ